MAAAACTVHGGGVWLRCATMNRRLRDLLAQARIHGERLGRFLPFRIVVAVVILGLHAKALTVVGKDRFDREWNASPDAPPTFTDPEQRGELHGWDRMLPARWDSQHYMQIGLRGYSRCLERSTFDADHHPDDARDCQLNFYPTYGVVGAWFSARLDWPIDVTLFRMSLLASFLALLLFTSRAVTDQLGVATTYVALICMNAWTSGFVLVTIQTEPLLLLFTLLTYWCLHRRWLLLGAIAAGAASAVRISGIAVSLAYGIALLVLTIQERPRLPTWGARFVYALVGAWGLALLLGYFQHRFGDPLAYIHSHSRAYKHEANVKLLLWPDTRIMMESIWGEPNDGVFLAGGMLWFALGHRRALQTFDGAAQGFWYALFAGVVGLSAVGSSEYGFGGMTRYMLCALPLFFAIAAVTRRRPVVLALWLYISIIHYWGGSTCNYLGQNEPNRFRMCGFARESIE